MARTDRIAACRAAEDDLAQRIEEYRPEAVVTLLMSIRDISGQQQARLETSLRYTLVPFPGMGQQARFHSEMTKIIPLFPGRHPKTRGRFQSLRAQHWR
jgi:hypothetical protein